MTLQWFNLAFKLQGSVAPKILPRVIVFAGFAFGVSLLHYYEPQLPLNLIGDLTNNVVFNLVLGLLLVFRTNTAYDRYWEGRKAWGILVVNIRNLSRLMQIAIQSSEEQSQQQKEKAIKLLTAFAIATKLFLRSEAIADELDKFLTVDEIIKLRNVKHPPLELTLWLGAYMHCQVQSNCIDSNSFSTMNDHVNALVEGLTACERILKTPLPIAYCIYLKRLILIYCTSLPFHLVIDFDWLTVIAVGLISFVLLGVEQIGNEIQNPFGLEPNDLPIESICETITMNVEQTIASQSITVTKFTSV